MGYSRNLEDYTDKEIYEEWEKRKQAFRTRKCCYCGAEYNSCKCLQKNRRHRINYLVDKQGMVTFV